ncbi:hypothetical protein [Cnuibacter physcomitrellae]|uniref:hypothetical protein n=1 Tax=Cnuibacter physcomitrellae TaxID=1619308 RepID=UPI0012F4C02A|nr:hypothetical protein [Cnuibacter physcomitrellae]
MADGRRTRGVLAMLISVVIAAAGLAVVMPIAAEPASAANAADFDPGNIISDENFFNGDAMSAQAVQSFLNGQVSSCRSGYTCLKDYSQSTWTRPADAMCGQYTGAGNESSATIIYKVGKACGVSQAVLIVLLEKEQSLITDTWPSARQYQAATGFACPDTAPCDAEYSGFYNQVYKAAWQYKRYTNPAGTSAFFTWFPVGRTSNILYNPNAACGSGPVLIKNKATAGLYYYTPYQPNATAMSNVYGGQTDGCSSYGNRNFWRLYTDWFGDPRSSNNKYGSYDNAYPVAGGVQVTGWAVDSATDATQTLNVSIDGNLAATITADYRLDWISAMFPGKSANHGFTSILGASPGRHTVCVVKQGGIDLGCKVVTVPSNARAAGYLDVAEGTPRGIHISGWAVNKTSSAPVYLWVSVKDGAGGPQPVNIDLPWTGQAYPGTGTTHGFDLTIPADPGIREVCVYGVDSILLACKVVTVPPYEAGKVESATGIVGGITVKGYSLDQRKSESTYVWITVDGNGGPYAANQPSDTAAAAYPGLGKNHGFSATLPASPGDHRVCVIGTSLQTDYGCQTVTVPHNEIGSFDTVTATMGTVTVSGWSMDRTSTKSTYVWVFIDGVGGPLAANQPLNWIDGMFGKGANHGFSGSFRASAGTHQVCIVGTQENVSYGCKTVDVPTSGAASLDSVTTSDRKITLSGWAVDRLSTATTYVWVTVDGVGGPYAANRPLDWINNYFPGVGPNHGFLIDIPATVGNHTVCVRATHDGQDLGCRTVNVPSTGAASIDSVTGVKGGVRVQGWAVNRATTETTYVWVFVDGAGGPLAADKPLSWIDSYFPGVGPNHGIDGVIAASPGSHQVCVTATFDGANLGCRTVVVP